MIQAFALCLLLAVNIHSAEVRVFAAASLTDCLKTIARDYEKQSGDKIVFNFGASNFLARQIEAGAPADIFFSADEPQMDGLEKKGLIVSATRRNRLSNSLVIVVPKDLALPISSARELTSTEFKHIALADPEGVPAGIYAKAYLQKQNLWRDLSAKIIPTENVRAALAAVDSGNVEAAVVYKTDAAIARRSKIGFEIPVADTPPIRYPVALLKDSRQPEQAKRFLDHLFSPLATVQFRSFGFQTQ